MNPQVIAIFLAPLSVRFGVMLILVGMYSLTMNIADAKRKNHQRAEKTARIGGWLYIGGGAAVLLKNYF